jgi:hypothetical protein
MVVSRRVVSQGLRSAREGGIVKVEPRMVTFIVFVVGTFFNTAAHTWFGDLVRRVIRKAIAKIAEETLEADAQKKGKERDWAPIEPGESLEDRVEKMGGNDLFGGTVGWVERQLYLYALSYGVVQILQAVVVFKGFAGWVTVGVTDKSHSSKVLSHFYGYTIGNLISLALAIAFYEASLLVYYALSSLDGWPVHIKTAVQILTK